MSYKGDFYALSDEVQDDVSGCRWLSWNVLLPLGVTILTDCTSPLFRPLMTPGLCGAEQQLSILCERLQMVATSMLRVCGKTIPTVKIVLSQDGCHSHIGRWFCSLYLQQVSCLLGSWLTWCDVHCLVVYCTTVHLTTATDCDVNTLQCHYTIRGSHFVNWSPGGIV